MKMKNSPQKMLNRSLTVVLILTVFAISATFASQTRKPAAKPAAKTQTKKPVADTKKQAAAKSTAKKSTKPEPKKSTTSKSSKTVPAKKTTTSSKNSKSSTSIKGTTASKSSAKKTTDSKQKTSARSAPKKAPATTKTASTKATVKKTQPTAKSVQKTAIKPKAVEKEVKSTPIITAKKYNRVIVSGGNIQTRATASNDSPNIETIRFGTPLKVYETTGDWSRIGPEGGNAPTGWVKTSFTAPLNSSKDNANIYRAAAARRLADDIEFGDVSDIVEFLTRSAAEINAPSEKAGILLDRLLAMRTALNTVPVNSSTKEPYKSFLSKHDSELVYSDPSAEYFVNSNEFWRLHENYKSLAIGEEIAWQAAQNPIPGECEGYVNCYLYVLRVTYGEYLNFYPSGRYSELALSQISAMLEPLARDAVDKTVYTGPTDISDRASFNQQLSELRKIISNTQTVEKNDPLAKIQKIADGYR